MTVSLSGMDAWLMSFAGILKRSVPLQAEAQD